MTSDSWQTPVLRPTTIAVHDDGNVLRNWSIGIKLKFAFFLNIFVFLRKKT
ncbi:hypothetical protein CUZ89_1616 [Enterococcus xinjiangensis]|nr:hypothetical protein [Enterococcus lactis]